MKAPGRILTSATKKMMCDKVISKPPTVRHTMNGMTERTDSMKGSPDVHEPPCTCPPAERLTT